MVVAQGDIWWADLPVPTGSGPGFQRPVVVVQSDAFNRGNIATIVCVPLTSNLRWADAPGNTLLPARATGLPKDSRSWPSTADGSMAVNGDRNLALFCDFESIALCQQLTRSGLSTNAAFVPTASMKMDAATRLPSRVQ